MKFEHFVNTVVEFEVDNGFADIIYLEAIKKLENVRNNLQKLDTALAERIIYPFLACWGRMERNVGRADFDWELLVKRIKKQEENFNKLRGKKLLKIDFKNREISGAIENLYDEVQVKNLGSTGKSKVLHLFNPELFMMWDGEIRKEIRGKPFGDSAKGYLEFMEWIQKELREALGNRTEEKVREKIQ